MLPDGQAIVQTDDDIELHNMIRATGKHNFMGARIAIQLQLNVKEWERYLMGYWDKQLIHLICHGFPLSFDNTVILTHININHNSANAYPNDIKAYLQ